jgi:dienelactone hydrolase
MRSSASIVIALLILVAEARAEDGVLTSSGWILGTLHDDGRHVRVGGGDDAKRVAKADVLDAEGGPPRLLLDLLANRTADLDDDDESLPKFRKRVRSLAGGDPVALAKALRKGSYRRPEPSGPGEIRVHVPAEDAWTECAIDVPPGYDPKKPTPLIIGIHFTGGTGPQARNLLRAATRKLGCLLACPTGLTGRKRGWMFTEKERDLHRETVRAMRRRFHVDPSRIVLVGWSRGGHASWDLGVRHPDVFAGIMPVVGGLTDRDAGLICNLAGRPIRAFQGARDQEALVMLHRRAVKEAKRAGCDVVYVEDPARGHDLFLESTEAALREILARPCPALPDKIVFATLGAPANGAWWVRINDLSPSAYDPKKPLRIPGARRLEGDALRTRMLEKIRSTTARVDATIAAGNRIEVKTRHIRRLTILLPLGPTDPALPVTTRVNGRAHKADIVPDLGLMLETVRRRSSRSLLPWGSVIVTTRR